MANPKALAIRLAIPNIHGAAAVEVFHIKGNPPESVMDLFDVRIPLRVIYDPTHWHRTDLVLYTAGSENARRLRLGARLGATYTVMLPAANEWTRDWIASRIGMGMDVHLFLPYPGAEIAA